MNLNRNLLILCILYLILGCWFVLIKPYFDYSYFININTGKLKRIHKREQTWGLYHSGYVKITRIALVYLWITNLKK